MKAIIDGLIVLPNEILGGHIVLYEGDKIVEIRPRKGYRFGLCTDIVDANGGFVCPGFINEHIHGIAGADAMDESDDALTTMQKALPKTGVTSFLPTTMTYDKARIEGALQRIRNHVDNGAGARVIGAHMEGPFINADYKGSQEAAYIATGDMPWLAPYQDIIKIMTIAPETVSHSTVVKDMHNAGIILSIGHSAATYEEVEDAVRKFDMYHVPHLFNAMPQLHHRKPGIIGAALTDDKAHCELICDNLHVHPTVQKLVYRLKGPSGIILVTDSLRACLMGDGPSELGGQNVMVKHGEARLADGTIAASVAAMNDVVLNFILASGASIPEAVSMATVNPAKDLGIFDRIGSLEAGKLADITILDSNDFHVKQTLIGGKLVYDENNKDER